MSHNPFVIYGSKGRRIRSGSATRATQRSELLWRVIICNPKLITGLLKSRFYLSVEGLWNIVARTLKVLAVYGVVSIKFAS